MLCSSLRDVQFFFTFPMHDVEALCSMPPLNTQIADPNCKCSNPIVFGTPQYGEKYFSVSGTCASATRVNVGGSTGTVSVLSEEMCRLHNGGF